MQRKLVVVARGLCDVTISRPFTQPVANRPKTATTLPNKTIVAQYTAPSDVLWPMPETDYCVNMT